MAEKKKRYAKSYRFDEDMIADIASRAAYYHCSKTDYLTFLVKRDCASDYSDETLLTYRIDGLEKKIDRQKLLLDEVGNLFLAFMESFFYYMKSSEFPYSRSDAKKKLELLKDGLVGNFINGEKTFLENLFGDFFVDESSAERQELQERLLNTTMSEKVQAVSAKEHANE